MKLGENVLKGIFVPFVICVIMMFSVTSYETNASELIHASTTLNRIGWPFSYSGQGTQELTMTIECGTRIKLTKYIGYKKNKKAKDVKLDRVKGKKTFFVNDPSIVTISTKGIMTAVKEGETQVEVTYKGVDYGFKVVVVEVKESQEKGVKKLKKSVANFNKGIKSKKSITRKNRTEKLIQLSDVFRSVKKLDGSAGLGSVGYVCDGCTYKGVCVIPDYCDFVEKMEWFDAYCAQLDPTNLKGKMPFEVKSVNYDGDKIVIQLNKAITEDQVFGFKTHSWQRGEMEKKWGYEEYTYFTKKNAVFDSADIYAYLLCKAGETEKDYFCRGTMKVGDDKIVLTPYYFNHHGTKTWKCKLSAGSYYFDNGGGVTWWTKNVKFNVR